MTEDTITIEQLFEEEIEAITEYVVALKEKQQEYDQWSQEYEGFENEITKMKYVVQYLQDRLDGAFDSFLGEDELEDED